MEGNDQQYDNSFNNSFNSDKKKQQNRRSSPYKRVREDDISVDERLLDNSLKAKVWLAIQF